MSSLLITEQILPSRCFFKGLRSGSLYVKMASTYYLIAPSDSMEASPENRPRPAYQQADDQYVPISVGATVQFTVKV